MAIILILLWWVLVQLSAPTWCFVLLAVVAFLKCLDAFIEAIKTVIEAYDKELIEKANKK